MCGITGYIGKQKAASILINGLKRLEYRGYDSAGVATCEKNKITWAKKTGRVVNVEKEVNRISLEGNYGIGHTRWATHGDVTDQNTHPHVSADEKFAMVHNGVIENYRSLKKFLITKGFEFFSETDSEVLVNLISFHYGEIKDKPLENNVQDHFVESVRLALLQLEGTYGIAVISSEFPEQIIAARKGSPLIVGFGKGESFVASDVSAFAARARDVIYLNDGEIVSLTPDDFSITTAKLDAVSAVIQTVDWDIEESELGEYSHYMQKEIFEQPEALENSMRGRFSDDDSTAKLGGLDLTAQEFQQIDRIVLCGCGTAWHACLTAEYLIERFARIPVEVEYASELRYRNAPFSPNTLIFAFSQSGETIDTLQALRESNRKGFKTLAVTNTVGSTIARETNGGGIYQHIGQEVGVASTKAFTSQVLVASMIALYLGRMRDMSFSDGCSFVKALKALPQQVESILAQSETIKEIAKKYAHYKDFLFLGRQSMFPIALEGALKLKEISYIHAEGYPSAEMKHGPIALISEECPSVMFCMSGELESKTLANMQEVRARKGKVIAIVSEACDWDNDMSDDVIMIPEAHEAVRPILATIPVQLLSYYIALELGRDVDKPRNLAKSVTVE